MKRPPWKRVFAIIAGTTAVLVIIAAAYIFWPQSIDLSHLGYSGAGYNVHILRDTWGVPHIFGPTDADAAYGLAGRPDVLLAIYGKMQADGRFVGYQGDSYVMLVAWDSQGEVQSYSIHQYGSATLDETSPHYADQAPLFAQQELKPV